MNDLQSAMIHQRCTDVGYNDSNKIFKIFHKNLSFSDRTVQSFVIVTFFIIKNGMFWNFKLNLINKLIEWNLLNEFSLNMNLQTIFEMVILNSIHCNVRSIIVFLVREKDADCLELLLIDWGPCCLTISKSSPYLMDFTI